MVFFLFLKAFMLCTFYFITSLISFISPFDFRFLSVLLLNLQINVLGTRKRYGRKIRQINKENFCFACNFALMNLSLV